MCSQLRQTRKLLTLVDAEFDVFITSDKNLRYQQNLSAFNISIILLPSNQVPVIESLLSEIEAAVNKIGIRDFIEL